MRVNLISPWLLLHFFRFLHEGDERFAKTEIIGAVSITARFDVRLVLPSGATFKLRAYHPFAMKETIPKPIELEFLEVLS